MTDANGKFRKNTLGRECVNLKLKAVEKFFRIRVLILHRGQMASPIGGDSSERISQVLSLGTDHRGKGRMYTKKVTYSITAIIATDSSSNAASSISLARRSSCCCGKGVEGCMLRQVCNAITSPLSAHGMLDACNYRNDSDI